MTSITQLQKKSEEIDIRVKNEIKSENPNLHPITDGIINIKEYNKAKYKILWVLKEPYYDKKENGIISGGKWDIKEVYNAKTELNGKNGFNAKTFYPMIYTSWAILNDFTETSNMIKDINDKSVEMIDAFKRTAYINIKKIPVKIQVNIRL